MLLKDLTKQEIDAVAGDGPDSVGALTISGLTADSRAVEPGFVFAALKGAKVDGAEFIEQAVTAGAAAILIDAERITDDIREQAKQVPLIAAPDARHELALMAAAFSGKQPEKMVAVTGTAGKTSVAVFVRQIFEYAGLVSASLGTIGTVTSTGQSYGGLTTPDPVSLHEDLKRLAEDGITHAAMEASSHGLDQHRLDGVRICAAGFTNLGRDHMDYHPTVEDYLQAKLRLFRDLLPDDGVVVVDPEARFADRVLEVAKERGLKTFTVGVHGEDLKVLSVQPEGFSQVLELDTAEGVFSVALPLAGDFQVSNALIAAGLAVCAGVSLQTALEALTVLRGATGRIEHVGTRENGALVFVDYAHKPEALENVLAALRPFAAGRLINVFGCGGDRDAGKRPLMGEISARLADVSIVTNDNPRTEDPDKIREEIVAACPAALEIGDRALAIHQAVKMLQEGDVLCVAGKGHETGQIIGTEVLPFSDHEEILKALAEVSEGAEATPAPEGDLPEISLDLDEMDLLGDEGDEAAAADALDDDDLLAAVQSGVEELEAEVPINPDHKRDSEEEDWLALEEGVLGVDELADAELSDVENHDPDFGKDSFPVVAEDTPEALEDELLSDLAVIEADTEAEAESVKEQEESSEADADAFPADEGLEEVAPEGSEDVSQSTGEEEQESLKDVSSSTASEELSRMPKIVASEGLKLQKTHRRSAIDKPDWTIVPHINLMDPEIKSEYERQMIELPEIDRGPLWQLADFLEAVDGDVHGDLSDDITGISIDSRGIQPGETFFAIKGENFDGHAFAGAALEAGAAVAVVARDKLGELPEDGRYVAVDDVLKALERLGVAARTRSKARIIAVTGSVGKTGTKEALRLCLSKSGLTHAPVASFNNHWGVPLTLARMPADTEFAIFEIGMNHRGEITPLVKMVRPHVAIVTTVEAVHLEAFNSVEDIARAKAEIFTGIEPGGVAILNRDNRQYDLLRYLAAVAGVKNIVSFGLQSGAQSVAKKVAANPDCSCLNANILGQEISYKIGAPGAHHVINSLGVLTGVMELGANLAFAGLALADMSAPKGRGAQTVLDVNGGTALLVDESYNANPASMRAAINLLAGLPVVKNGRRIAVLGDMLELGVESGALHADLAQELERAKIDVVYCVGTHMKMLWDQLPAQTRGAYSDTSDELEKDLLSEVRPNDIVMVKGSLGTRMGPLVDALKKRFPEPASTGEF